MGYRQPGGIGWIPPEKGPYKELGALAKAFDAPYEGSGKLEAEVHGMRLSMGLLVDSGKVEGVSFEVTGRTWPSIVLRRETEDDREAKKAELARELQTGDDSFDQKVYVESDAPDDVTMRLLGSEDRRRAVLALLVSADRVTFGESGIHVTMRDPEAIEPAWVEKNVLAHLRLLTEAPAIPSIEYRTPHERLDNALLVLAVVSFFATIIGWGFFAALGVLRDGRFWIGVCGGIVGFLVLFPALRVLRRIVRGHSRAQEQYEGGAGSLFMILVGFGSIVPVVLNATIDGEPRRVVHGVVTTVGGGGDGSVVVHVRWDDGSNDDDVVLVRPTASAGDRVWSWQRRGMLGWRWEQRGEAFVMGNR